MNTLLAKRMDVLSPVQRKITEMVQTLRLAKKTSKDDYFQHLRLVVLGLLTVGGIAFVMKLIAEFVTFGTTGRFG
ncbi:MAG: protein translocase SEC61 complex subunit gamma [Thermoproteota archaeon]|nr:protein translocase SEC61 complex subunit gamma [Thermoproteota archaeon]